MNIAIILAGGIGSRIGGNIPKQFIKIAGKSIIEYSIEAFEKNSQIDKIAVVVNKDYIYELNEVISRNKYKKLDKIINGGDERYESSLNAVRAYEDTNDCNLIFHDAVRPLISQKIINGVIKALKKHNAVTVAIPATDTIYNVNAKNNILISIPDRKNLFCAQTPQAFNIKTIRTAFDLFLKEDKLEATDDCSVVSKLLPQEEIFIVAGSRKNIKITNKEDIVIAENLINSERDGD